jgi:hypothetical protein
MQTNTPFPHKQGPGVRAEWHALACFRAEFRACGWQGEQRCYAPLCLCLYVPLRNGVIDCSYTDPYPHAPSPCHAHA